MNIRNLVAVPIASLVLTVGAAANAQASGCDPELSATGCFAPVTCDYERWYPGVDLCGGQPWSVSIKEECDWAKKWNYSWWKHDDVCQSFVKKNRYTIRPAPKFAYITRYYTVKRGDTLWSIAKRFTGKGSNWKQIATANHISGTTIYPGQILKITVRKKVVKL